MLTKPNANKNISNLVFGTFFVSLSALFFEILSVRTMGFVLGSGYVYFVIGIAMLGLSAAGSIMCLVDLDLTQSKRNKLLSAYCFVLAFTIAGNFFLAYLFKENINDHIINKASKEGLEGLITLITSGALYVSVLLGSIMAVPYFVFGIIITIIFRTSEESLFHKVYFSDLLGAGIGCIAAVVIMEFCSFQVSIISCVLFSVVAGIYFSDLKMGKMNASACVLFVLFIVLVVHPTTARYFEPRGQLNTLARDYQIKWKVDEIWHAWNSFTRISAIRSVDENQHIDHVMSLGNGEGHAKLVPYKPEGYGDWAYLPSALATALDVPKDVLVLFAGTGADMLAIDYYVGGRSRITGVELNRKMVNGALGLDQFNLKNFYGRSNINLVTDEARAHLGRDDNKYDIILLSWSGATTAYYSGSIGHTTQYVYTREAFESIYQHLKPGGTIVVMSTNKLNTLALWRSVADSHGVPALENTAVVLYSPGKQQSSWQSWWDVNKLLIKPSGFSENEVKRIAGVGGAYGLELAYAPRMKANPEFLPYRDILTAKNLDKYLKQISKEADLRFSVVTDDRPFSFDLFLTKNYFSGEFWGNAFDEHRLRKFETYRIQQIMFVSCIILGAIFLIIMPMFFAKEISLSQFGSNYLVYFSSVGAGFMFVEIGLMQKMTVLFGNPALSISIVLATIIFFAGVGSAISQRSFARGFTFPKCVLSTIVYFSIFLFVFNYISPAAMSWPVVAKAALVIGLIAPGAIIMGHFFPQGLIQGSLDGKRIVPWAWAINGASGTVAAGLAPLVAQIDGFQNVIIIGLGFYALILMLPRFRIAKRIESSELEGATETAAANVVVG